MVVTLIQALIVAWLPGALVFRAPFADRSRRTALAIDERLFWSVVISLTISSIVGLGLAAAGIYAFPRLLAIDAAVAVGAALVGVREWRVPRWRIGWPGGFTWWSLVPIAVVAIGMSLYFPPAEYVIGGKDPGTYMNEGIQIAQRGTLVVRDPTAAAVPPSTRDLFFPSQNTTTHYSVRFMGFFLLNPDEGSVVGQFPHLYPVWIAIGYGLNGLTGARQAVGFWAILGVLAVYFAGARLAGRPAAASAAGLLAVHVVQVWFARYPNSEVVMQALAFAALLALSRCWIDGDRFFGPLAAVLIALMLCLRIDAALLLAAIALALGIGVVTGRPLPRWFFGPLAVALGLAGLYLFTFLEPYLARPLGFLWNLQPLHVVGLAAATLLLGIGLVLVRRRPDVTSGIERWLPRVVAAVVVLGAAYALFLRQPSKTVAPFDAASVRTYAEFYVTLPGLAAAVLGFVLLSGRAFWRDPAAFLVFAAFGFFFFYKTRIWPEHFWMARRFLPVILPATLLLIGAAAASTAGQHWRAAVRARRLVALRPLIGLTFLAMLGTQYWRATGPVRPHVEYAGVIPKLEQLAGRIGDADLVLVESRNTGSDLHVLALPLSYIYARNVLVLASPTPDRAMLEQFLTWAREHYREVFFLGGGGTDLLSSRIAVLPVASDRFQVPEYESLQDAYPRGTRQKEFDYSLYRFVTPTEGPGWFTLDVGAMDDLLVVRFRAKEKSGGTTFRWTGQRSYVSIVGMRPDTRMLTIWMADGGRPPAADPAEVTLSLDDVRIGQVRVSGPFRPYTFSIPAELAAAAAANDGRPARLQIVTPTWNPRVHLGVPDDRDLGVMVDRVEVR